MRYIAMQLRLLLQHKFPDVQEDDILKIVGNLVYYRYMNPAIVAPDAFDIIDVGVEKQLTPEQVCARERERESEFPFTLEIRENLEKDLIFFHSG